MKSMKFFILFLTGLFLFIACNNTIEKSTPEPTVTDEKSIDTAAFLTDLTEIEDLINSSFELPKEEELKTALTSFQDFASIFPNDDKAADYLFKASDLALALKQPEKSVKLLERVITEYPTFKRMEDVMYNKASHLDFELRDTTAAKEAYQAFIDKYPNSVLVNDSKLRIENIRYSIEELTEKFLSEMEQ